LSFGQTPNVRRNRRLVKIGGFAPLDPDCAARTMSEAGAKPIAQTLGDQPGLSIDDPDGALMTLRDAQPATVA
jgi:hypothetical protein